MFCVHLQPLADALRDAKIKLTPMSSPYGGDDTWWQCDCTFAEAPLRKRLKLDASVKYVEYEGMSAGSDATWSCKKHKLVIIGPHPKHASKGTPKLK